MTDTRSSPGSARAYVRNIQGAVHLLRKAIHASDPRQELDLRCSDIWNDLENLAGMVAVAQPSREVALEAALKLAREYLDVSLGSPSWTGPNPYPVIDAALALPSTDDGSAA